MKFKLPSILQRAKGTPLSFTSQVNLLKKKASNKSKKFTKEFKEYLYEFLIYLERPESYALKATTCFILFTYGGLKLNAMFPHGDVNMIMAESYMQRRVEKKNLIDIFERNLNDERNKFKMEYSETLEYF